MTAPPFYPRGDQYPPDGQWVTVRGVQSTDYLERGQQMVVRWSPFWQAMTETGYVRPVDEGDVPDAAARFPTVQDVLDMIGVGATTLPGQRILAITGTGTGLTVRVGVDEDSSREFTVEWPVMEELIEHVTNLRDETEDLADNARDHLDAAVADLRDDLAALNGIAAAAAEIALSAAEESGLSAYELAVQEGYSGTVVEWLASLKGEKGDRGLPGPKGDDGVSMRIMGTVATVGALPSGAAPSDAYLVTGTGNMHVWSGSAWVNVGPVQGPQGPEGPEGPRGLQGIPGERGEQGIPGPPGTTLWSGITGKPSTFPPTIGTTSSTAKAGNWVPAIGDVTGLSSALAAKADLSRVNARPATWLWNGSGTFTPPAAAVAGDTVINLATGEIHTLAEG